MLCLSRKVHERILVGNDIVIEVIRIGNDAVRLGISAPSELNIVREELIGAARDDAAVPDES